MLSYFILGVALRIVTYPAPSSEGAFQLQNTAMRAIIPPTKARNLHDQGTFLLPWQDLTQQRHTKLCFCLPPFATGLCHLYYSHTTFENNHILPQHDENNSRRPDGRRLFYHLLLNYTQNYLE